MTLFKKIGKKYEKIIEGKLLEKEIDFEKEPKIAEKWGPDIIAHDRETGKHLQIEIKEGFAFTDTIINAHELDELARGELAGAPITTVVVAPQATKDAEEMAKKFKITLVAGDEEEIQEKVDKVISSFLRPRKAKV